MGFDDYLFFVLGSKHGDFYSICISAEHGSGDWTPGLVRGFKQVEDSAWAGALLAFIVRTAEDLA